MTTPSYARLRGRVDQAGLDRVHGWAFDEADPERQVVVSVFVDDHKIGQAVCDRPRRDLLASGRFGSVGHGFDFRFQPRLGAGRAHRVTVRFLESGRALERGDAMVPEDSPPIVADFGYTLPGSYPAPPAPRRVREWFELLTLFAEERGLYDLVARCDFTGRRREEVVFSVHGASDGATARDEWDAAIARDEAYTALMSTQFQRSAVDALLAAWPDKRRRFFIHVPKCAGTDLSAHLGARYPALHQSLGDRGYTSPARLFSSLAGVVRLLPWFDTILVHGHINLGEALVSGRLRPIDSMFTVLRPPIDIAISQTNYVLTRIEQDLTRGVFGPDSRDWLARLGLEPDPARITEAVLMDHRLALLRDIEINRPETICHWLGGGSATEVLERLVALDAEVTTTRHYGAWLGARWGIEERTRRNESRPFLRREDLDIEMLDYLHDISVADRALYEVVEKRIIDAGGVSFFPGR